MITCFLSTLSALIIWPGSIYLVFGALGWFGESNRQKASLYINKYFLFTAKSAVSFYNRFSFLKFRNMSPFHKNIKNLIINFFLMIIRLILGIFVMVLFSFLFVVIIFFTLKGLSICYQW